MLPARGSLTKLVILYLHKKHHHVGVNSTLVLLREKFWVPKARQTIKSILSSCMLCKHVCKGRIISLPPPCLPLERVKLTTPFQTVGVDYTGAINVFDSDNMNYTKVCVCLFTCTWSRAVH